jgi:hypothetical protein
MLLTISRAAEFDNHNIPQPGQTNPQKPGWDLRLVGPRGAEVLYHGPYRDCLRLQERLAELGEADLPTLRERIAALTDEA